MTTTSSPQNKAQNFIQNFLLGGVSAAISKTTVAPIERIKMPVAMDINQAPYKGRIDYFIRVCKEEGVFAFWRGNFANVRRYIPVQAFNFAFNDVYKKILGIYDPKTEFWKSFSSSLVAGGLAGATSLLIIYPIDFARTRLAVDKRNYAGRQFTGLSDCLKKIYAKEGVRGLYPEFCVSVLGTALYRAIYFGGYDTAKKVLFTEGKKVNVLEKFLVAQGVTAVSFLVSYPFDTVRMRMRRKQWESDEKLYKGIIDCFQKIYSKEGGRAFFIGALTNKFVRIINGSLGLVLFDELQAMMSQNNAKV